MNGNTGRWVGLVSATLLSLTVVSAWSAEPYVPPNDDEVVTRVPTASTVVGPLEHSASRSYDLDGAIVVAERWIETSRRSGDARYLGHALSAISPWLKQEPVPVEVMLLHAVVLQAQHRFDAALAELKQILQQNPVQPQARLTQAVILQVQGRPEASIRACGYLSNRVSRLTAITCMSGALRLTPRLDQATQALRNAIDDATDQDLAMLPWSLRLYADMVEQTGDIVGAGTALRQALVLDPGDVRTRTAYADLLLRSARHAEVMELISPDTRAPALLLRRVLAARGDGLVTSSEGSAETSPEVERERLARYFNDELGRAAPLHLREAARAYLEVFDQAPLALRLALRNWTQQRELEDARLVLAAAVAAADPVAADPVVAWIERHRIRDARLDGLLQTLRTMANHVSV